LKRRTMNTGIGVDTSLNSATTTVKIDGVTVPEAGELNYTFTPQRNFPTVVQIVNGVVVPTLEVLLYDVLGVIDASIPNKEQNRAVKRIIHDGFDKAYLDIIRESYPDSQFSLGPGHALTPKPDKSNAVLGTALKL
jgi:hypothetical protein